MVVVFQLLLTSALSYHLISCQDFTWTWLQGSTMSNAQRSITDPGGRSGAAYWPQADQVWMFGGEHHKEHSPPGLRNDLWSLDVNTMSWRMVHNGTAASADEVPEPRQLAAACGIRNTYFILFGGLGKEEKILGDTWLFYIPDQKWYRLDDMRVKLGARNKTLNLQPEARGDSAVWCQGESEMAVFGGFGENHQLLHDLWKFDLEQMSWAEAKSSAELPRDANFVKNLYYPNGRSGATTWVVGGRWFMFGGNIAAANVRSKHLNYGNAGDMWEYNQLDDVWFLLKESLCTEAGNYGKLGWAVEQNYPGCRRRASGWVDSHDNLWMFGGDGVDNQQSSLSMVTHSKLLSDIWHFDTKTHLWTWKGGQQSGDQKGEFGYQGKGGSEYLPGSRCESVVWSNRNYFYLFGGVGHDGSGTDGYLSDVWKLDVQYDPFVKRNSPYPGPVFGLIFLGLSLVIVVSVLYMFNRGRFKNEKIPEKHGKYSILTQELTEAH